MLYILDARYRLRGWHGAPAGVYDTLTREARFIPRDLYQILLRCDAAHELDPDGLSPREKELFQKLLGEAIVRPAGRWDFLLPEQRYRAYPARYRKSAQWSVTGACNLSCWHCFMSAPYAKHGSPSHEEIMNIADQHFRRGDIRTG